MRVLNTIFLILFFSVKTIATNYYVRTDGSNSNAGTTNSAGGAWLTVSYAAAHVTSGDIINVQAGTFNESTQVSLPVGASIEGVGVTTIITSTTLTSLFQPIISLQSSSEGTNGNQHISNLKMTGNSTAISVAIGVYARSNVSVHDCTFEDFDFSAALFCGKNALFPNNIEPTTYATNNSFYNNITTNCSGFKNWGGLGFTFGSGHIWTIGQQDMAVYSNTMNQTARTSGTNGWLIKATDFTKGIRIYNNTMTKAPYPYTSSGFGDYWDFAIEMGDVIGCEIYNNTIQGSIDVNRNNVGTYAFSLYIHDNAIGYPTLGTGHEGGIICEYETHRATIERNTFKNITEIIAFSTRTLSQVKNILIQNNLAYNIGQTGMSGNGAAVRFISDGSNNYIVDSFAVWHNTFVANATLTPYYGFSISNAGSATNVFCMNNIFNNWGVSAVGANNAAPLDYVNVSYNNFYSCAAGIVWNSGIPSHYTSTPNTTSNPSFVAGNSYALSDGSQLKNAGSDGTDVGYTGGGTPAGNGSYLLRGLLRISF